MKEVNLPALIETVAQTALSTMISSALLAPYQYVFVAGEYSTRGGHHGLHVLTTIVVSYARFACYIGNTCYCAATTDGIDKNTLW